MDQGRTRFGVGRAALAALALALAPVRQVRDGATGGSLVAALGQTGRLELAYGLLLALGVAIRL